MGFTVEKIVTHATIVKMHKLERVKMCNRPIYTFQFWCYNVVCKKIICNELHEKEVDHEYKSDLIGF